MIQEFADIIRGIRRTLGLIDASEKRALLIASLIMLITGVLTNVPALVLGKLVDQLSGQSIVNFRTIYPYLGIIIISIFVREALNVLRKYSIENVATQTEKQQTVATVGHILHADTDSLANMRVGTLHGRIFRSIEGLVKIIKLCFLEFLPTAFTALAALVIALTQKPLIAGVMLLVIPAGLYIIVKQIGSQKGIRVDLLRGKEEIDGSVVETRAECAPRSIAR